MIAPLFWCFIAVSAPIIEMEQQTWYLTEECCDAAGKPYMQVHYNPPEELPEHIGFGAWRVWLWGSDGSRSIGQCVRWERFPDPPINGLVTARIQE
jgi:hypothetical protein